MAKHRTSLFRLVSGILQRRASRFRGICLRLGGERRFGDQLWKRNGEAGCKTQSNWLAGELADWRTEATLPVSPVDPARSQ